MAPVVASAYVVSCPTTGHVVICTGKDKSRNTRPANAGLNGLLPNPPKDIFATPIAKSAPNTIIQIGRLEGKLKASNTPVIIADPSAIVERSFFINKVVITHSKKTQAATDVAVTIKAPNPKKTNDTMKAGISAISTPYIFFCTLSPP